MIASEQEKVFAVFNFVSEEEANGFYTLLSSIYVVTDKEEFTIRAGVASYVEKSEEIEILAVDVTKYLDRRLEVEQHRLLR